MIIDDRVLLLDLLVGVERTIPGVSVVATGTDAERIAGLDRIDLLVVDRSLPSGDGMEITREVVARHPAVTSVVIAGSSAPSPPMIAAASSPAARRRRVPHRAATSHVTAALREAPGSPMAPIFRRN